MLAAASHDIPPREHSHLNLSDRPPADSLTLEDRLCPGCKKSVVNEQGGLVVAFGQSFFHVDCFKCAKCRNQVTADTNLLLLSDGSPICADCSYSCNICHLPILDEAIMTGDDSYHAHCFKCKVCSNRIDELVFAKTSQGIYCMNCHNERMIKIRKHAQKKAERDKANGGSGSSRSREHRDQDQRLGHDNARPGMSRSHSNLGASSRSDSSQPADSFRTPAKPSQGPYRSDAFDPKPPSYTPTPSKTNTRSPLPPTPARSPSLTTPPSVDSNESGLLSISYPNTGHGGQLSTPQKSNTLPILPSFPSDAKRRSSRDDGVRPLHILSPSPRQDSLGPGSAALPTRDGAGSVAEGLSVPSRQEKRQSINPGLLLPSFHENLPSQTTNHSPLQTNIIPPERNGALSINDQSQSVFTKSHSRPPSRSSSVHSTRSPTSQSRPASNPNNTYDDNQDDTIVMTSPPSMSIQLGDDGVTNSHANGKRTTPSIGPLSPRNSSGFQSQRRVSSSSNLSADRNGTGVSRSTSPAYRADVPHGVESGTDTEAENDFDGPPRHANEALPPLPPPKDAAARNSVNSSLTVSDSTCEQDNSDLSSQLDDLSDDIHAENRMSRSTFIAPALPPIRFPIGSGGFDDLLNAVKNMTSPKAVQAEPLEVQDNKSSTPPPPNADILDSYHYLDDPLDDNVGRRSLQTANSILADVPEEHDSDIQTTSPQVEHQSSSNSPGSPPTIIVPTSTRRRSSDIKTVIRDLRGSLDSAKGKGSEQISIDIDTATDIIHHLESRSTEYAKLKSKLDGMNRESKLYVDGISVAQTEYDREFKARREAEAEVTRLRVLLSGQAARLTSLSGDNRRTEEREKMYKELTDNLSGLERDFSRIKVERDLVLAEVEELSSKKANPSDVGATSLGRALTKRMENIRHQYEKELIPLNEQKEALSREIAELKSVRDVFLEETTVLNARNEELAQLNAVYSQRIDSIPHPDVPNKLGQESFDTIRSVSSSNSSNQQHGHSTVTLVAPALSTSTSASSAVNDDGQENKLRAPKSDAEMTTPAKNKGGFKWPGSKKEMVTSPSSTAETIVTKGKAHIEHNFQQLSVLRFTRCDHCGDKMWGSQLRCSVCSTSIHVRCIANVSIPCAHTQTVIRPESPVTLPPSMFGRDLVEQVEADAKGGDRQVPVIVEKCIEAVELRALEYEGIYRKTGGSGQTKAITHMFERGDYNSFDLRDADRFNDICSITSVLKTYFRTLPVPLLTFDLHDQFMTAIALRDQPIKQQSLIDLIDKLPDEHYYTLRMLMLHLNRVRERCEVNLMTSRNLGVVFGPTLLRSRDPGAEFSDMAGKALFVEWLVDNAPMVFSE